jgi:hypothetical protein
MRRPIRHALVWVIVPALAFRALTALHLDLHGPLHFHVDWLHEHEHEDDAHAHSHAHGERHHHAPGDPTVVTLEDHDPLAHGEEEAARGWSATMCVAAAPSHASLHPPPLQNRFAIAGEALFRTRFLGRLERPPLPVSA